ncbi:MAG: terminase small subunit [Clostridia bacterium]|nr:terminase small subunit [Clostridia bacterium]
MKGGCELKEKTGKLTPREKQFCSFYVNSGNLKEAAICAGFHQPEKNGAALLLREDINKEIERIYRSRMRNYRQRARAGYERLAFGNVSDAVRLMFEDNPLDKDLETYDLFNVAEIKRPKDGAMEIKFFDRIKALEKLECAEEEEENNVSRFYSALVEGTRQQHNMTVPDRFGEEAEGAEI